MAENNEQDVPIERNADIVQRWQPSGPILEDTTYISKDDPEQCARFELHEHLQAAYHIPEIKQSPIVQAELRELISYFYRAFKNPKSAEEGLTAVVGKKYTRKQHVEAARIKAEKEREKPDPDKDYVRAEWDAWIAKPDRYDTLTDFHNLVREHIQHEHIKAQLEPKPPAINTMKNWAKDWPPHPRVRRKKAIGV